MKPIKKFVSLLLFLTSFFLFSCGNNLSRGKAEDLIKQKYNLPKDEIDAFTVVDGTFSMGSTKVTFNKLQNEGLLTYYEHPPQWGCIGCNYIEATLTEKGKQYAVSEKYKTDNMYIQNINVKVAKLEFGEITGIQEMKQFNAAKVQYTLIRKDVTPFGRVAFKLAEGAKTHTATLIKYDDGWRINE